MRVDADDKEGDVGFYHIQMDIYNFFSKFFKRI